MRMFKKMSPVVFVFFLLMFGLSANGYAKPTLVVYSCDPAGASSVQKILDKFCAENDVDVKLQTYPSDSYMQVVTAAVNAGSQIDVIFANGQDLRFMAQKGIVMELTTKIKYLDRFYPSMLTPFTFSGKLYGVPGPAASSSGVYYNKAIFAKAGITKLPTTYEEFVQAAGQLKKIGVSPIAMGGGDIYMWPMWYFQAFAQSSKNRSFERTVDTLTGKAKFTDPDYVEAFAYLSAFAKDNLLMTGVNGTSMDAARASFVAGKAAMFYGGTWELGGWYKSGMTADDVGILSFPLMKKDVISQSTGGPGNAFVIYSKIDASRSALALKLLDYATLDATNQFWVEDTAQTTPVNKNVKLTNLDSLQTTIASQFLPRTTTFLDWIWSPELTQAFQKQIQAIMGGQTTPEKATQAIQAVYDSTVKKGYKFFN